MTIVLNCESNELGMEAPHVLRKFGTGAQEEELLEHVYANRSIKKSR